MYSLRSYGDMIGDEPRMEAFVEALKRVIRPGDLVVEIGTGTGVMALLCCQLGAGRVVAIETDDAVLTARQLARDNGYADRIEFLQARSTDVHLPAQADVLLSDLRGCLPLFNQHIPSIIDARTRLLKPHGTLIPQQDSLWCAVVDDPQLYRKLTVPWGDNTYGLDVKVFHPFLANKWERKSVSPDRLLLSAQCWSELDYRTIASPHVSGTVSWQAERPGTGHGLLIWFDTELIKGVGYSNAPSAPPLVYGAGFFPWLEPVNIDSGDLVEVMIAGNLVNSDYVWRWHTRVLDGSQPNSVKAQFHQSSFFARPISPFRLVKRQEDFKPKLTQAAVADRWILEQMDGQRTIATIAANAAAEFPDVFAKLDDALHRVRRLSEKHSA